MTRPKRKLILITGIPGTGKTECGRSFASEFGFVHHNLEDEETLKRLCSDPSTYIESILEEEGNLVVTWGFVPQQQNAMVKEFQAKGFQLVWFDGNRPAALQAFIKRGTVPEELFYLQMWRIENSGVIQALKPLIINSFDENGQFKEAAVILKEIEQNK